MSYDRYCSEIVAQTDLLRSGVEGVDLTAPVPSCPGWNLGRLLRHVGTAHREAEDAVRTRATQPPPEDESRDPAFDTGEDPAVLSGWLSGRRFPLSAGRQSG